MIDLGDFIAIKYGLGAQDAYGQVLICAPNLQFLENLTLYDTGLLAEKFDLRSSKQKLELDLLDYIEEIKKAGHKEYENIPFWILRDLRSTNSNPFFTIVFVDTGAPSERIFVGVPSLILQVPYQYSLVKNWPIDEQLTCEIEIIRNNAAMQRGNHVKRS